MKLSNKKIKYIKRHASAKTADEIAKNLRISVQDVQKILKPPDDAAPGEKTAVAGRLDLALHRGLVFISFCAPFVILKNLYDLSLLPKMAFIQTGAAVLFLVFLLSGWVRGSVQMLRSPLNLPLLCALLWALISLGYAHNRYEGSLLWIHWAASASIFFIILNGNLKEQDRFHVMAATFVSGFFCATLGILQYLFGVEWVPQPAPPAATFANKNMAVHFVIMTLPIGVAFFLNSSKKIWSWFLSTAVGLMIVFLIYTQTRAGWLALSIEILFFAILLLRERYRHKDGLNWRPHKRLAAGASLLMILLMINIGPEGFKWGFGQVVERAGITMESQIAPGTSVAWRLGTWQNTMAMIRENFLTGVGIGNHKIIYPLFHRRVVPIESFNEYHQLINVHNDYLQAFAELGVIGMIFLLWFGIALFRLIFVLTNDAKTQNNRFWVFGLSVGIVGIMVNAGFSFPFQRAVPPFLLMAYAGLLASFDAQDKEMRTVKSRRIIGAVTIVVFLILSGLVHFHYHGIKNDRHLYYVTGFDSAKDWRGLIREGKKATHDNLDRLRILPYMGRAYVALGMNREAIAVLEEVLAPYPNVINYLFHVGMAYGNSGDYERALAAFQKIVTIKPDFVRAHINIARIYKQQKKLDLAIEAYKTAAALDEKNSRTHFEIGMIAIQQKQYREAAEAFERAVEIHPNWASAHKNLGIVYYQSLNRKKAGIEHFKKALALNPDISEADGLQKLVQHWEKQRGQSLNSE